MISFACKKIEIKDIVTCSFELNKTDYNLLVFLLKQKGYMTINDIANDIGLDRTSIQKSMKRLMEKSLVARSQENLEGGGYIFSYMIKDKEKIKKDILEMVNTWNKLVKNEIERW
jgi:predicted transcriptional regulator